MGVDERVDCPGCTVTFKPHWTRKTTVLDEEKIVHGRRKKKIEVELSATCPLCHRVVKTYERDVL